MFDVFSKKDLQNIKSFLLIVSKQNSTATIGELLSVLDNELAFSVNKKEQSIGAEKSIRFQSVCASCGVGSMVGPYSVDGLLVVRCSKKCGFSEVIG